LFKKAAQEILHYCQALLVVEHSAAMRPAMDNFELNSAFAFL